MQIKLNQEFPEHDNSLQQYITFRTCKAVKEGRIYLRDKKKQKYLVNSLSHLSNVMKTWNPERPQPQSSLNSPTKYSLQTFDKCRGSRLKSGYKLES